MDTTAQVLFGKTRQAVLALLFEDPGEAYYLRQFCQLTGISPGAMQAELTQLVRAGLVERAADGNRVSYRANAEHPVFESLREVVRRTCGIGAQIAAALRPLAKEIVYAGVFGSMAKGTSHARSDVDVLVVGSLSLSRALAALEPLERRIGRQISVRVFTASELRRRLQRGEPFLSALLAGPVLDLLGTLDDARQPDR